MTKEQLYDECFEFNPWDMDARHMLADIDVAFHATLIFYEEFRDELEQMAKQLK